MLKNRAFITIFAIALFSVATPQSFSQGGEPLRVTSITPSGIDIPAGRQIVFHFNRAVVPLGAMERSNDEVFVTSEPKINCQWRWLSTTSLACQLDGNNALKPATRYQLTMAPGIRAEDGATLAAPVKHEFTTALPKVSYSWVTTWKNPGQPVFVLSFNHPVAKNSLAQHLGIVQQEAGSSTSVSTDANKVEFVVEKEERDRQEAIPLNGDEARMRWQAYPKEPLAEGKGFALTINPGLVSAAGPEPGREQRQLLPFYTFPAFKFLGIRCTTNRGERILIEPTQTEAAAKCDPDHGVSLSFSSPVLTSQLKANLVITPNLSGRDQESDPWGNARDYSRLGQAPRPDKTYDFWLPGRLQPAQSYQLQFKKPEPDTIDKIKAWFGDTAALLLEDEFGRRLPPIENFAFATDHRKPNYRIGHQTAVLEKNVDSEVPLYVTNLSEIIAGYNQITPKGSKKNQSNLQAVQKTQDVSYSIPLGVRGFLDGQSGAVFGTVDSTPAVNKSAYQKTFLAIVSPYQVHMKLGHYNSQVWVTDFASGELVSDAKVSLYIDYLGALNSAVTTIDQATTDASGLATLKGLKEIDPKLQNMSWCSYGQRSNCRRFFVRVDKGDEMALLPLDNDFELNAFRASNYSVYANSKRIYGHIHTWGTTAQGVYRVGDIIQFKVWVRDQDNKTYVPAPKGDYHLQILDPTNKMVHEIKNAQLSEFGGLSGEFTLPKTAAVGWYRFELSGSFAQNNRWYPMQVLVSDFTPAPFKVRNSVNGERFKANDELEITSRATLHSGGAFTNAEARVSVMLEKQSFTTQHPVARGFRFGSQASMHTQRLFQSNENLGLKGEAQQRFRLPKAPLVFGRLTIETAVRDDRGKFIAAQTRADYLGVDRLVGLKPSQWIFKAKEEAEVDFLVVSGDGVPVKDTAVSIDIQRLETKQAKVKGAGNTYLNQYIDEWVASGKCAGKPAGEPETCRFTPKQPGTYRLQARISDSAGNTHTTEQNVWVSGSQYVAWHTSDDSALEIIPEKTEYRLGETAKFLVKNPYPGAKALVSVERYGVMRSWVQTLSGSTPLIEFPIEADDLPGFYISVLAVSPRVAEAKLMGEIDLGKPSYKMGYQKISVKDDHKEVKVALETDAAVYKPRAKVNAMVKATVPNEKRAAVEFTVAVLDEAVLDLVQGGKNYYDPYHGFYRLDDLDLRNYNLLARLIGRQKFEKKGANPGGDGGTSLSLRNLFKHVSYWNPALPADANGQAKFSFDLPDNLTGWRILAMAHTKTDKMGLGDSQFKVNLPTEIRPVMPNQVKEGDSFQAGFNVMNRSDKARKIKVSISASGDLEAIKPYEQTVELDPFQRQSVYLPVRSQLKNVSRQNNSGSIAFIATAEDATDGDKVAHSLPVYKSRRFETVAQYGTSTEAEAELSLAIPDQIHTDVGELSVTFSPSVIGNIEGAFRYMKDYPYSCWEQKLSKGVMAAHYQELRAYLPKDLLWSDSKALPENLLAQAANFQAPNGGMAYYLPQDQYTSPYLSAYTALAFTWLAKAGYKLPANVEAKLHGYLEGLLRWNNTPDFYTAGLQSTVRAIALAALASKGKVTVADLERLKPQLDAMSVFGKAHFLQAALQVDKNLPVVKTTLEKIMAHGNESGGKFNFSEELDSPFTRILASPLRSHCGALSALILAQKSGADAGLPKDLAFKLTRSLTQSRGQRDHFENTQENLFCTNALVDYARQYESTEPNLTVVANLEIESLGQASFKDKRDEARTLTRGLTSNDPGSKKKLTFSKSGEGRYYHKTALRYSPIADRSERINAGMTIRREYSVERNDKWLILKPGDTIKRGEILRIDLFLSLPTVRHYVVVNDPVPGGLEPINRDLATASTLDADKGNFKASDNSWWYQFSDWRSYHSSRWSFYHKELRHDSARFYSDYLPAGNYHLAYTAQAITEGTFKALPVHAEEMYDSDIFGQGLGSTLIIEAP